MKKLQNKKGFSLIFAMGLVLSISITILYLLEYVVPFAKDTKGIEFSSNAFYQSTSAVEDGLYYVAKNSLGEEIDNNLAAPGTLDSNITGVNSNPDNDTDPHTDFGYEIVARGDTIPPIGQGNSEFDPDWNTLAIGEPLQLEIGEGDWSDATISLRVPNTGFGNGINLETMTGGIVAWQLSSENETLISETDSNIGSNILESGVANDFNFSNEFKKGKTLEGEEENFLSFYNNCNATGEKCTLQLLVINDLILDNANNTPVPYLEYKIEGADDIPLKYTRISTSGYSHGFKKDFYIQVPQQTVNQAITFTVFQ